jgi:hypothetical protein
MSGPSLASQLGRLTRVNQITPMIVPLMYEHKSQPPLDRRAFLRRLALHGGYAASLIAVSLVIGMAGYHWIAGYSWTDAFVDACMLLGGMGQVGALPTRGAKIFAGIFALYSGLVFLIVLGVLIIPLFHRVLHRFHWEQRNPG